MASKVPDILTRFDGEYLHPILLESVGDPATLVFEVPEAVLLKAYREAGAQLYTLSRHNVQDISLFRLFLHCTIAGYISNQQPVAPNYKYVVPRIAKALSLHIQRTATEHLAYWCLSVGQKLALGDEEEDPVDENMYQEALTYLCTGGEATIPALQRQFEVGYGRAARLMDRLELNGVVSPYNETSNSRTVMIPKRKPLPKIYLDIDGTLIHEEIERAGEPAKGLVEFITALRPYDVYWLTTHCMEGDPQHAQKKLKAVVPKELHGDIDRIKPTTWHTLKTEAIDFSGTFIWFDNDVLVAERNVLREKALGDEQWLIEIDLVTNPHRQGVRMELTT